MIYLNFISFIRHAGNNLTVRTAAYRSRSTVAERYRIRDFDIPILLRERIITETGLFIIDILIIFSEKSMHANPQVRMFEAFH